MLGRHPLKFLALFVSLLDSGFSLPVVENVAAPPPRGEAELAAKAPRVNAIVQAAAAINRSKWTGIVTCEHVYTATFI